MFTVHSRSDCSVTFHFDAPGETPRRWHAVPNAAANQWSFVTDMCWRKDRKPGIPMEFHDGTAFATADDAIAAVLAMN